LGALKTGASSFYRVR